jgi:glycosyltransferase involved in cell wall biosynthesis
LDGDDIEVIPNGVDLRRHAPDPAVKRYKDPTVLYLGRLKKYKRVDLVLRAVAALAARGRRVRLLVAGKGDHLPALQALASRLEVKHDVEFLGWVDDDRKVELFRRSWVHVLTSPNEGWGISNMEAAACGTATVSSDAPGLRESVVDGRTGFLVPHGDVGALAGRIGAVLEDPGLRDRLGGAARAFAAGFSWESSADATEEFLRRVVRESRPG